MKVLLFTIEFPPFKGGVANYYKNIKEHWPSQDDFFVLAHAKENKIENGVSYDNFFYNFIWPHWLRSFFILRKTIKAKNIDHIIVGQILPLGTLVFFYSLFREFSYSVVLHGMDYSFAHKSVWKRFISSLILKRANKIIGSNSYVIKLLKDDFNDFSDKAFVVNPGISSGKVKDVARKREGDEFVLFSVGRLVKRKGFDYTIRAVRSVPKLKVKYLIAGQGEDEEYLRKLAGDDERIVFLGSVNDEEKWENLFNCDSFIMPSRNISGDFEGFGIVYLEAALASKPVIAGNSGGVPDAVIDGKTGIMVNPENVEAVKTAIVKLASDRKFGIELGENARKRVLDDFKWDVQIQRFYDIIGGSRES